MEKHSAAVVSIELREAARALLDAARRHNHRRALVLSGNAGWCREAAAALLGALDVGGVHWFSDRPPTGAPSSRGNQALGLLGSELDALVFDAYAGFDPDAFGALTGCVRGGGLLLLLTPPFDSWGAFKDPQNRRITVAPWSAEQLSGRFLQRLVAVISADPSVLRCENGAVVQRPVAEAASARFAAVPSTPYRSLDQQRAVEAVLRAATGHRRRPVVLTSDRGRGKSAAFGIAAAELILAGHERILVTGPRMQAAQAVLAHARALLPEAHHDAITFIVPDELLRAAPRADLLLVDEAAGIPAPLLEGLLKSYPRIAFATTVHGYEGTGRGFALRFNRCLDRYSNSWKAITLSTPIRFAAGDPLERLVFRMLLLDANAAPDTALQAAGAGKWTIEDIDRDQLLADETALSELFGLLVLAHYRTRPLDLRHLLDGPNLSVYLLRFGPHVAGAALVAQEGGFDADTAQAIWAGRIRPHGHLLPETLAAHQGLAEAPRLRGVRIVRIAVHPLVQRRGFGTRLVGYISERSAERGMDYIGSSFGTSEDVLDFWRGLGWLPVRLSIQADASSGQRSAVMLKALSEAGTRLMAHARERFFAHFPHQLSDSFRELDTALVRELMRAGADSRLDPVTLGVADWKDVEAFALHQRLPEVAIGALWRLACKALMETGPVDGLEEKEATVLVARILQKRSWPECARLADVSGRGPAQAMLRRAAAKLIRYYHGQVAASVDSYPA